MVEKMISSYVDKLSINDVNSFALKNNINLNYEELNLVFNYIKKDWRILLYGEPKNIFNDLKSNLDKDTYLKVENLYLSYKAKYQDYL